MQSTTTGQDNVAIGVGSLYAVTNATYNVAVGSNALTATTGNNNVALGYGAGSNLTTGGQNIVIGYNQQPQSNVGDYQINIGGAIFATNANGSAASPAGQVGIGTSSPHTSAILDLTSTTKGLLLPRLTTTQINAISTPAAGLTVYNTDINLPCFYNGTAWRRVLDFIM